MARSRQGGQRMSKRWDSLPGAAGDMSASGTNLFGGALAFTEAETVIRMLGEYIIFPTAPLVAADEAVVGVGIGLFSVDAVNAGATAVSGPVNNPEYLWLYWANHPIGANDATEETALGSMSVRVTYDIRSMRKAKPREQLALVFEMVNVGSGGTPPLTAVFGSTRVLLAQ